MRWRSRRLRVRGEFFVSWVEEERGPAALSFFGESKRKGQVCRGGAGSNASAQSQTQAFLFFSFCVKAKSVAHYRGSSVL